MYISVIFYQVECQVPWLNDALVYFTLTLQLCQQLRDKVSLKYLNMSPGIEPIANIVCTISIETVFQTR